MTALGISLMVIGAIVIVIETHVPSMGALGGPGVIALAVGAVLAVAGFGGGLALGLVSAFLLASVAGGMLALTVHKGTAVRRRRVRAGPEGLIGRIGTVRSWEGAAGKVQVEGALWRARASWVDDEQAELHEGDAIVVERLSGLTLAVRPAEDWELVV
jgi:membrane-bound serine protease (ClpP class)